MPGVDLCVRCRQPFCSTTAYSTTADRSEADLSRARVKSNTHSALEKGAAAYKGVEAMSAEDIAESIFWTTTMPRHFNVNRMEMMPVMQAFSPFAIKREEV